MKSNTDKSTAKSKVAGTDTLDRQNSSEKIQQLDEFKSDATGQALRTNQGVKVADDLNSLKAGVRGSTLLEDFILREKITHFDHERIPERIVHARGSAAHGYFQSYKNHSELTKAEFLQDPTKQTPVFVRFSTVQGPRGSADTVRDVRGFSVKFYTDEGNYDLVGNNIPVFFIQDAIKFPDLVHAVKPEPHNEIPTGQSAHDTFWDFISLTPESAHMVMWQMSDRAIPRNLHSMQGFGVHTFRFINSKGKGRFVKFHWKPLQGVVSLVWDEAQKIAGKDPDFHRRDLWDTIESGHYPEWELGVQVIEEEDEHKFDFDILDATKIIPEELVPITPLGKMILNRNPDNFFAETEQVAFCPAHIVPGIDFSNDPLLQGRLFSYTDTQLSRLGGPNFHEIPINRPVCPFHNHQRDGIHRNTINKGQASYHPNSIDGNWPQETPPAAAQGGFESYQERIDGHKIRQRSPSFSDHFSQARLFFHSLSKPEQQHVINAYSFELGKVQRPWIRERTVNEILANIDLELAQKVALNIGVEPPTKGTVEVPEVNLQPAPSLSQMSFLPKDIKARKISVLVSNGVNADTVEDILNWALKEMAVVKLVGPSPAPVKTSKGEMLKVDAAMDSMPSIMFDAVVVVDGDDIADMQQNGEGLHYLLETYKHLKPLVLLGEHAQLLEQLRLTPDEGTLSGNSFADVQDQLKQGLLKHRVWAREPLAKMVPA
ncbi:catalase HPII [Alkanindiges illinoisensis]|uniref:Catalase n=1 Tax=Alkanindiges illinoisensis TaxID=197183 RepID=A0A4Y7XEY2_9GAMM|nr:catalase HPII [Alkanindiges illinoisensis]TEU30323.1 catalase HPII [Alkanindiges illinoisensis]